MRYEFYLSSCQKTSTCRPRQCESQLVFATRREEWTRRLLDYKRRPASRRLQAKGTKVSSYGCRAWSFLASSHDPDCKVATVSETQIKSLVIEKVPLKK